MRWRVIDYAENDAFMNMAIDEAVSETVSAGGPPAIRFYGWKPDAVSIGYFQRIDDVVDLPRCGADGVSVVRRRTGGGAVFHDGYGEITYSVIGPENIFPKDILASYRLICGWVSDSLSLLGIESGFKPINDIQAGGRNYLVPVNARVQTESDVEFESVDAGRLLGKMETAGNKTNIVILDACRDNPFERAFPANLSCSFSVDPPLCVVPVALPITR